LSVECFEETCLSQSEKNCARNIRYFEGFFKEMEMPTRLSEIKVREVVLDELADVSEITN